MVQILGTGCAKCKALTANAQQAIDELGVTAEIENVGELSDIARMGIKMTPTLAVDGRVRSSGHLLSIHHVKEILVGERTAK